MMHSAVFMHHIGASGCSPAAHQDV